MMLQTVPAAALVLLLAPLAAMALSFFVLRPLKPAWAHWPILASCAAVTAASAALAAMVCAGRGVDATLFTWMAAGDWALPFGVRVDGMGVSVLCMVTLVGSLIHLYAAGYMRSDPGFARFFLFFHLFFFAMIGLLLSNNYVQFYLFWELVGACSYFLIGHWLHKPAARRAALQAFLVNRVGDFGLMLGVLILLALFRDTRFSFFYRAVPVGPPGVMALAGLLLIWAAAAKSAQFPLYFWLPDAMEGPTPVSALMHAATMVTAGIFLLVRSWPLLSSVPGLPEVIAAMGAFTAVAAAGLAFAQTDLKRILAYSTVSHLGIMAFGVGLGQLAGALFHLITHGFFKAGLFLCAGIIAHESGRPTVSVSEAGGLRRRLPLTFACFLVCALSLAGIWPLAGFFSKDAILDAAAGRPWTLAAGLAMGAGGALYIFRMLFLVFWGPRAEQHPAPDIHEAPPVMGAPTAFLALGAASAGWGAAWLPRLLGAGWPATAAAPELPHPSPRIAAMGLAAAAAGLAAAYVLAVRRPAWDWEWRRRRPALEALLLADLGWRTLVGGLWARVLRAGDRIGRAWDRESWDAAIEGSARACRRLSESCGGLATGRLPDALWWMTAAAAVLLAWGELR